MSWREDRLRRQRARELELRLQELDRIDEQYGLGAWPDDVASEGSHFGRKLLVAVVAGAVCWWGLSAVGLDSELNAVVAAARGDNQSDDLAGTRGVPAYGDRGRSEQWVPPPDPSSEARPRPPVHDDAPSGPTVAPSHEDHEAPATPRTHRNPEAPPIVEAGGTFAFQATQTGTSEPVTWDPCQPIEVVINPDGGPQEYRPMVEGALTKTANATGLSFTILGETEERPAGYLGGGRDGKPVLFAWATADEVPALAHSVAGAAQTRASGPHPSAMRFVTGMVVLDIEDYSDPRLTADVGQAILDHEVAHLVGLDHVNDPEELMFPTAGHVTEFGPGDLEGLARLGNAPCG